MTLLWRIVLARSAQAGALILLTTLFVLASHVVSSIVTVEPNKTWRSSEAGLHLAWKIEVRNPLRELSKLGDRL
jgi:hypothetical protein